MKYVIGIDLGSTTTKAVVFGEDGKVLGRGITNTRSNYEVACAIARSEALITSRFALFGADLHHRLTGVEDAEAGAWLTGIEQNFRLEQYRNQLAVLRSQMHEVVDGARWHCFGKALGERADLILDRVEEEAQELFAGGGGRRSEFFRDLAGGRYRELAEDEKYHEGFGFDALMSCFDKSIVKVENESLDLTFEAHIGPAVRHFLEHDSGVGVAHRVAVEEAVEFAARSELEEAARVGTGYGRQRLPFAREEIRSEILCHGLGAHAMFPDTRTVLDIGGQDTKAIQVDGKGIVTSFQMNDRCAAGCGRYLGYIADEMNLAVQELGPLAERSRRRVKINSTCTVFAGAELRDRLALGQRREDVVAGLHRAIVLRAMSLLARSGGVRDQFTFTGGVANNTAAVSALHELVRENYGEITTNISADSIYTGAHGAALFALRDLTAVKAA